MNASIIILTYNNFQLTQMCLESILARTQPPDYEVIVVDNASQDGTPAFLEDYSRVHTQVQVILNPTNTGFAHGNNQGAAAARGDYLVFLNNDTVVTGGWLEGLLHHLDDPQVGMVGPVTNSSGNESRITVDYTDIADLEAFAQGYTLAHAGESFEIAMLPFLCVALRREVFEQVGPLDERFGLGMFEDDDYALRLKEKGYKILCAEDVYIHHWGSASFSKLGTTEYWALFQKNLTIFEEKWKQSWLPQLLRSYLQHHQRRQLFVGAIWLASHITARDQEISNLQEALNEKITTLQEQTQQYVHLAEKLAASEQHWAEVEYSRSWRLVQWLGRLRLAIIPKYTRRERLMFGMFQTMGDLLQAGLPGMLVKLLGKISQSHLFKPITKLVGAFLPKRLKNFNTDLKFNYPVADHSQVILYADPVTLPKYNPRFDLEAAFESSRHPVKVTLISTVRNEAQTAETWLTSLLQQSRPPDEVIITDGGSTDRTASIIRDLAVQFPFPIQVIEAPGVNISKGRNIAIQNASHPVIACADFGCVLDKDWLQNLVIPFEVDERIQVSCGGYRAIQKTEIERLYAQFFIADPGSIKPQEYLPSSRSLAFRKSFWIQAGGYPEWLTDAGEDTLFNLQAKLQNAYWAYVPGAQVLWKMPTTVKKIYRTILRYARGDGESGVFGPHYHYKILLLGVKCILSGITLAALILSIWVIKWWALSLFAFLALYELIKLYRYLHQLTIRFGVSFSQAMHYRFIAEVIDSTQAIGYLRGVWNRPRVRKRQIDHYIQQLQHILGQYPDRKGVIVYPATHDWGFMFQRPHQMARAFARRGYLYFFCTNNEKTDTVLGFREVEPNLYLCHVPMEVFRSIEQMVLYIGSPWHRSLISELNHPPFIYDHYDDLKVSSGKLEDHEWLLRQAGVVLVTSHVLANNLRTKRPDAIFAPNGVDLDFIQKRRPLPDDDLPLDLRPIVEKGCPLIGYSGALAEWFDYQLLENVARARPDYQFVLIGTSYDGSLEHSGIFGMTNVHWLGMKSYAELFHYVWRFDVGIIPFLVNDITVATSPIKQFEYMACEKPVVATALPECRQYPNIFIAEHAGEFAAHLERALRAKNDPVYIDTLLATAQANTWHNRVQTIIERLVELP